MDRPNTERDPGSTVAGSDEPSVSALENVTDPIVAVEDGTLTYANAAAIDAFDLPVDPAGSPASVLGGRWDAFEDELTETAIGTVRTVELEDDAYDARVHRGEDGATITFDHVGSSPPSDRRVKDRAINEAPVGVAITDPSLEDNPLVYVNEAFERVTGYPSDEVVSRNCRFLQGENTDPEAVAAMRSAIEDDRPVTVELQNYRRDGTEFWNEVTLAPVRDDHDDVTHYVGFQNDVTARKRAELEVKRRRAELEEVLARVEGLVQDVTADVAGSTSRSALETAVCERIAAEDAYDGAWIEERNPATDALEVRASAGVDPGTLATDAERVATEALERGEHRVETIDGVTLGTFPLTYNDIEYGAVTVCTGEETAIDEREEVILSALARAIASGINARETSRMLETDAVVEIELDVVDETVVPIALSTLAGCELEYHQSIHRSEGETASLFTVRGTTEADLEESVATLEGVGVRTIVERDRAGGDTELLVELTSERPGLVEWLSTRGALTRTIHAAEGRARVGIELPQTANVRAVVEALEERYPGTDVVSFHRRERTSETHGEFATRLEEDLTDRQLTALQRAHLGGYFEWPRPTTGEELAASMDISRPTFHEHLRTAEAKLCRALFETE